jgi:hypothetical protein
MAVGEGELKEHEVAAAVVVDNLRSVRLLPARGPEVELEIVEDSNGVVTQGYK